MPPAMHLCAPSLPATPHMCRVWHHPGLRRLGPSKRSKLRAETGGRVAGPRSRGRGANPMDWTKESRLARWRRRAAATGLALLVLLGAVGGTMSGHKAKMLQNRMESGQIEYVSRRKIPQALFGLLVGPCLFVRLLFVSLFIIKCGTACCWYCSPNSVSTLRGSYGRC